MIGIVKILTLLRPYCYDMHIDDVLIIDAKLIDNATNIFFISLSNIIIVMNMWVYS